METLIHVHENLNSETDAQQNETGDSRFMNSYKNGNVHQWAMTRRKASSYALQFLHLLRQQNYIQEVRH